MKKVLLFVGLVLIFSTDIVYASTCYRNHSHSGSSCSRYIVGRDSAQTEQKFANCDEHYLLTETTTNFYSDGTRRTYYKYSVLDEKGNVVIDNCTNVEHVVSEDGKHYLLLRKNKQYGIYDGSGKRLSVRPYTFIKDIDDGRLLVKFNKHYGVIDLNENVVVPIKYKYFEQVGKDLYLTKLNGYYGLISGSNQIFVKNEYDKIKPLYDTFVLKKCGKFGLADINGNLILDAKNDKIENLGEFIVVKHEGIYKVYDSSGKLYSNKGFLKVRLKRNVLEGKYSDNDWQLIIQEVL